MVLGLLTQCGDIGGVLKMSRPFLFTVPSAFLMPGQFSTSPVEVTLSCDEDYLRGKGWAVPGQETN